MRRSVMAFVVLLAVAVSSGASAGVVADKAGVAEKFAASGKALKADAAFRDAYAALWAETGFFIRKAVFITDPARSFGVYQMRPHAPFAVGEPIRLYLEPAGFGAVSDNGTFVVSFQVDVEINTETKTVVWGRRDIHRFGTEAAAPVFDLYETLTFDLAGLPSGSYTLRLTLTDLANGKEAEIAKPFSVE